MKPDGKRVWIKPNDGKKWLVTALQPARVVKHACPRCDEGMREIIIEWDQDSVQTATRLGADGTAIVEIGSENARFTPNAYRFVRADVPPPSEVVRRKGWGDGKRSQDDREVAPTRRWRRRGSETAAAILNNLCAQHPEAAQASGRANQKTSGFRHATGDRALMERPMLLSGLRRIPEAEGSGWDLFSAAPVRSWKLRQQSTSWQSDWPTCTAARRSDS